ncbi:MAG: TlpA family protein disulfide reductase [Candidatus Pelagibacter sp.]
MIIFFILSLKVSANITDEFKNFSILENPKKYEGIVFEDFDGKSINLKDIDSKIYIMNFWATWCGPCKEEMPYLDEIQTLSGIAVVPVNLEAKNPKKTEKFFDDLNIKNLSIFFDNDMKLVKLFKLRGVPTTIILNKNEEEIARIIGSVDFTDEKIVNWLKSKM